jgi:hypothetical protein
MAKHSLGARFILEPFRRGYWRGPLLTRRRVTILLVLSLVGLQVVAGLSAPLWARLLRRPVAPLSSVEGEEGGTPAPATPSPSPLKTAERRINVKLFFEAVDRPGLVIEERAVVYSNDLSRQLAIVLQELIRGSDTGLANPLAPATRVLDVFATSGGYAYADFSSDVRPVGGTGSQAELDAVYAIVNTLTVNFPAVTRVQILVADRPVDTLAGHMDLSRPLPPDMTLLAPVALTPLESDRAGATPAEALPN